MSFNTMLDQQVLQLKPEKKEEEKPKEEKGVSLGLMNKEDPVKTNQRDIIRDLIIKQRRKRERVQPTKLTLLDNYKFKRGKESDKVTFSRYVDPVKVNKEGNISVSEKFKRKVKASNKEIFSKFTLDSNNHRPLKDHQIDDIRSSNFLRLKKRFDNILRSPMDSSSSLSKLKMTQMSKEYKGQGERLSHMMKIFCKSGFPEKKESESDSKDHPFWTRSQNRILKSQKTLQSNTSLDKVPKLDLAKLRKPFLPEARYKQIFENEQLVDNIKKKLSRN